MYVLNKIEKEFGIKLNDENCIGKIKEIVEKSAYANNTKEYVISYIDENEENLDLKWAAYFLDFLLNLEAQNEEGLLNDYDVLKEYPLSYYTEFEIGILKEDKNLAEAKAHLEKSVELKDTDPLANYYLGSLCFKSGEYKRAKEYYKVAQKNASESPYEKEVKARAYYGIGAAEYKIKEDMKALVKNLKGGMNVLTDLNLAKTIFEGLGLTEVFEQVSKELRENLQSSEENIENLNDYLTNMTKTDLTEIRKSYDIKGASKLNKVQLAELISEELPKQLEEKIKLLDGDTLLKLKEIIDNGGQIISKEVPYLTYFKKIGILVHVETCLDELKLVIPADIMTTLKDILGKEEVLKSVQENDELFKIINGLMQYYGVAYAEDLEKIIHKYDVNYENVSKFIENCGQYSDKLELIHNIFSLRNITYIKNIIDERENYQTVDYYEVPLKDAMIAGANNGQILSSEQLEVYDYLKDKSKVDENQFNMFFKELVIMLQYNYSADKIMKLVEKFIDIKTNKDKNKLTDNIFKLNNNTRLWALKGNTPADAFKKKPVEVEEKIGRNDPCPCGSGKKYKKCCMNK
ncbi:hypothetical protein CCE28_18615 [Anaeromicrobium sediminis]|uniref:Rho termination factor N-terminal domain-containing protein n=1 Tax=Anaeromicrobium sediminis TaxID=1478221 RepID=A0A267MF26_9FIRM|nr:SEC-C metal-binding domain-containing protein [Anaeromicrobium sediminis]PAB57518.1 hypothetical protein CCE28_18615 [Anaeromicrobium sediminis]